jgi:ABC-2 type transport system permease protein
MRQIKLIIQREYLSRVRKKSFLIMTILGPLLVAAMYGLLIWLVISEEKQEYSVLVYEDNSSKFFTEDLQQSLRYQAAQQVSFKFEPNLEFEECKRAAIDGDVNAVLHMPSDPLKNPSKITLHYHTLPSPGAKSEIEMRVEKVLETYKAQAYGLSEDSFDAIRQRLSIATYKLGEGGIDLNDDVLVRTGVGLVGGFLIYFFIFLYGVQVLRGVMEEKTSRIVEVIISSVRPFQLMMGKIIGVGLVGLTQFLIWVLLSIGGIGLIGYSIGKNSVERQIEAAQSEDAQQAVLLLESVQQVNFPVILLCFLFYFLAGYLLYSALFAAIGAAVDSDTDSQQFMMPVTLPLIFSVGLATYGIKNPDGAVSVFFSIFPLTSPVVMMSRIGFNPPVWQVLLSMGVLVLTFIFTTWIAGRIYRTGILMYGKKVNYKELWRWLRYNSK